MASEVYDALNKAWKSTCRILLGEEIGELKEYEGWLKEQLPLAGKRKSHLSNKNVALSRDEYCEEARFVSHDEAKEKAVPLDINEIKDIDSIIEAISEKWEYVGNKILGNSAFVESSDGITDSQYILDSTDIFQSSYIYASTMGRLSSKYVFGGMAFAKGEFLIRFDGGFNIKRAFETYEADDCSDVYFSHLIGGCNDLLFCFAQRSARNRIGNLQLPKDRYLELKKKLVGEIREELKKSKRFPSLFELIPKKLPEDTKLSVPPEKSKEDIAAIDDAFSSTMKVLFKTEAEEIDRFENWLSRRTSRMEEHVSPFGIEVYTPDCAQYKPITAGLPQRLVSEKEALELGKLHLDEEDITSLERIINALPSIMYVSMDLHGGTNINIIKSAIAINSMNIYKTCISNNSESCGVNFWVPFSKYMFGCYMAIESEFCIKCYSSLRLKRCFELDACSNCSDTYFAHNCEGLREAMFCFNAKGKRYAIGNSPLPPDQYRKIKDMLVEQMADEILKKKELKWDIFNVGCYKK